MDPVQLYYFLQKTTFPVRVRLRDGRSYDVATREFAVVGVTYLDVGSQAPNASEGIWEHITRLQVEDISGVEPLVASEPVSSN